MNGAVIESMDIFPYALEKYKAMIPYLIRFDETKQQVLTWFQVAVRLAQKKLMPIEISRMIGLHLWNKRFECIPDDGQVFRVEREEVQYEDSEETA